ELVRRSSAILPAVRCGRPSTYCRSGTTAIDVRKFCTVSCNSHVRGRTGVCAAHARSACRCTPLHHQATGTRFAAEAGMFQRCAYYLSPSKGALRLDLTALEPDGPYRLILDDSATRHIEYFSDSREALERWAEFDAAMRPHAVGSIAAPTATVQ